MRQSWYTDHVLCHINCSMVCFDLQGNDKPSGIHEKNVHVPYKSGTIFRVPDQECLRWMKSMPMESLWHGKTMPWITLDKIVCNCKM